MAVQLPATLASDATPPDNQSSGPGRHSKNRPEPFYTVSFPTPSFDWVEMKSGG